MATIPALESAAWQGTNLVITDPEKIKRIRRKNLSASVAHKVIQCPAAMAAETLLPRPSDPFAPTELGSAAHTALEYLYQLLPVERTREALIEKVKELAEKEWSLDKLEDKSELALKANDELKSQWTERVTAMALGDFALEDPTTVDVHATELDIKGVPIGTGVPFRGFLDRTDRVGSDEDGDILEIDDYKTGTYRAPNPRFSDDYADQLRLYTVALGEIEGRRPVRARLLYLVAGKTREIDLSEGAIAQTLFGFDVAWRSMNHAADHQSFPAQPSALCAWCPLANSCPVAKITSAKAVAHAKTQPSREALGIPVLESLAPAAAKSRSGLTNNGKPVTRKAKPPVAAPAHLPEAPRIESVEEVTPDQSKDQKMTATAAGIAPLAQSYPTSEYAAMSVFSLTDTATSHLSEQGQVLNQTSIAAFTTVLAGILNRTTRTLFGGTGWEQGRLARVEFALKGSLAIRPAPFGKSEADWQKWTATIEGLTSAKATVALGLLAVDDYPVDAYKIFVAAEQAAA